MIATLRQLAPMTLPMSALMLAMPVQAQSVRMGEVTQWQPYGAPTAFERLEDIPGRNAVAVDARAKAGEPWASGAGIAVPFALRAGERITATFWARSDRAARVPATIQGGPPDHAGLASSSMDVGPAWRRFAIAGVAPRALAAGSQSLTVQLGRVPTRVQLGPVAFLKGRDGATVVDRAFAAYRPARIAEDVRIRSEPGVVLAGTLKVPATGAAHPVVLLLGGGGPAPRGIFPLLEQRLLARGIATLSYDKRGVGQSTGTLLDTNEVMIRDATAAIAWLRERPDLDPRRVALFGLSQGAVIAPAIAAGDPAIATIALLAAPAGRQGVLFLDAMCVQLARGGHAQEAVARILAAVRPFMEARAATASEADLTPLRNALTGAIETSGRSAIEAAAWTHMLADPVVVSQWKVGASAVLAQVRAPVLALYAEDDAIVFPSLAAKEARLALSGNPDAAVAVMPGMNHGFQRLGTGPNGKPAHAGPPVSDPATLDRVTDWLSSHLKTAVGR